MTANERPDWRAGLPDSLKGPLPSSLADLPEGVRWQFERLLCEPAMKPVWRALDHAKLKAHINPADRPAILRGYLHQALWADGTALANVDEQKKALAETDSLAKRLYRVLGGHQGLRSSSAYPGLEAAFRNLAADDPLVSKLLPLMNGVNPEGLGPNLWAPFSSDELDAGYLGVCGPWAILTRLTVLLPLLSQLAQGARPQLRADGSAPRKRKGGPSYQAYARRLCAYCRRYYVTPPYAHIATTTRTFFSLKDALPDANGIRKLCLKARSRSKSL